MYDRLQAVVKKFGCKMHWKVKLEGADGAIGPLANSGNPAAQISRDGVDWFLESGDFALMSDHLEVKERASQIMQALGPSAANIALGPIYRIHYDNSKSVFR